MDLIIRNARLSDRAGEPLDIGIENGRIAAIGHALAAEAPEYDAQGRLACPGLIETHIHLDKSRIIDRCAPQERRTLSPVFGVTQRSMMRDLDRKSTRLNSSHQIISYAVFCLKKKKKTGTHLRCAP